MSRISCLVQDVLDNFYRPDTGRGRDRSPEMKLIGDKNFYKRAFALILPIFIQTFITNFVSMLDNIMVGKVGTAPMTGVAVANQILNVLILCIFGTVSGAGIMGAQFFGNGDLERFRDTFRFKIIACVGITLLAAAAIRIFRDPLIGRFLSGEEDRELAAEALSAGRGYLEIMLIGLIPYALVQAFSSTLREGDRPVLPMVAGLCAVGINLVLNYVLIFGHFGAPRLGVNGAAIATVISRFAELLIVVLAVAFGRKRYPFMAGAFRSMRVPARLVGAILTKALPLILNETMWALGNTVITRQFSLRGLEVVAAYNIELTFFGVFFVVFQSVGAASGIIVGQHLGAGDRTRAKEDSGRLIALSVGLSLVVGAVFAITAAYIPLLYNVTAGARSLAAGFMRICAFTLPLEAAVNAIYFILRSGGRMGTTILFDSGFSWAVVVPTVILLIHISSLSVLTVSLCERLLVLLKLLLGLVILRRGKWARTLT